MSQTKSYLTLPDAPAIPGLAFRFFQGKADFPSIEAVREAVRTVDGDLWRPGTDTNPDAACNLAQDCLLAEVDGKVIGYTWLAWWEEMNGTKLYLHLGWLVLEWRRSGLGKALMTRMLQRCQERGITQADIGTVAENPGKSAHLYESVGYQIVSRHPRYRKPM